jgi:hypothetical protein
LESSSTAAPARRWAPTPWTWRAGAWTCHGDWCLPFKGHGHYDSDLGEWVGTQTIFNKDDCSRNQHLCSCDVPEIGEGKAMPAPDWKLAEKTLTFLEEPLKSMYGSTLLPMGCTGDDVFGRAGMLCLIERTLPPGVPFRRYISDGGEKSEVSPPCDHVPS